MNDSHSSSAACYSGHSNFNSRPACHSVVHVITPSRMAGAETLLNRMARRLRARGHRIHIVANRTSPAIGALVRSGLDVELLPIGGKFNPRAIGALIRALRKVGGEIFHSHLSTASWWCGWAERFGGPPSVGHVHGFTSALWHRRQKRLIACSAAVRDHLVKSGIDGHRIDVLHNPVDPEDVQPCRRVAAIREELATEDQSQVIGCFAHFSEKKGWRDLLHAAPAVLREYPETTFWCVGDGPIRTEMEQLARELGVFPNFRFPGFRTDACELMNAIDVMALPSHCEPFGLVYVEAGLLKKPVIACRAGGAPEVVIDHETGLLIPPHDPDALADALRILLDSHEIATAMGRNGYHRARDLFGWDRFLDGLESIYRELAEIR
ncbi:MAG: glycosyltransferase family 4 protein [Pirellulales bacterium]|nr:glycosyltransferase family 4 protein [Pirellulales bacterium]